ncbi:hypothetical protein GQ43DRAFT_441580 [Delitschia confertaspora ATCC 74209]|uniref:Uncharacterized protein n=1 Tax=Delitschia confertaspora ATCC 74209 TaxID=1513339 RepID=A0A9P4MRH3_9PLEO|nr:hypothetical protein GQ43DRAFT_441580 [Delitschia confertaspora ATCC 74209]
MLEVSRSFLLPTPLCLLFLVHCTQAAPATIFNGPSAPSHASRERKQLPVQIVGIVGGYVLTVLIWGVLLLTVGRRMRRKAENSPKSLELELVTARPAKTPMSPASARSATSWFKKGFKSKEKGAEGENNSIKSPISPTSPSSFDQKVIEADRERAQAEMERLYAAVMDHDRKKSLSSQASVVDAESRPQSRTIPPRINTSARPHETQSNPASPRSPIKAIYPPNYSLNGPPTAPLPRKNDYDRPSSPRSILSRKSQAPSERSTTSKTRFNLKNLRISGPIQKYPGESMHDEARTPLSPRFYNPGAPPSPPTNQNSPTSIDEAYEGLDEVQPLPHPAPQRKGSYALSPSTTANPKSASSSSNSLPLRSYTSDNDSLKSPGLKTTFVDRRREQLSLQTPRTGVPFTPYSPYMPFTPVTPVTPHLVTRGERKRERRENGRKVATRGDMVQSPKEIFGDGWE